MKYSKNKQVSYEKKLKKILETDNNNKMKIKKKEIIETNDKIIKNIAFEMSNISNDKLSIYKYIEKPINYIINNTIRNSINKMKLIPDFEKRDINFNIGLKLSLFEKKILQDIIGKDIEKWDFNKFYEIYFNNFFNNEKMTKFCTHLCR